MTDLSTMMTEQTDVKEHKHSELVQMYNDAKSADQDVFAEQRSNILLIAGDHYTKQKSNFYKRVRDSKALSDEVKLRLTKNHIGKIHKTYVNNIVAQAPGVGFDPKDPGSMQNRKSAELNESVWQDGCERQAIETELVDDWADSFVGLGEVATKIYFDPQRGKIKAFDQATGPHPEDPETEVPMFQDAMGQDTHLDTDPMTGMPHNPKPDYESPIYEGELVFEEIYGFNLLRDGGVKKLKDSPFLGIQKMVQKDKALEQFGDTEENKKFLQSSTDETTIVFDADKGRYAKAKDMSLLLEWYFRPCKRYPNGYFYIFTREGILSKGELPGGIFPIEVELFDRYPTAARGRSIIKTLRPYQAEVNRSASKMAEHQVTLGDDKIFLSNGSDLSPANVLPGVRGYTTTGAAPTVLAGRDGSQYLNYMQSQISEMYMVANIAELAQEDNANLDPYVLLFRSASQKIKFKRYVRRFERFLQNVAKTYLQLAKVHFTDDQLVYAVGKQEQINIAEFKSTDDLCYQINIKAQSDDIETKLGQQLVMNHIVQYAGAQMKPEDLGRFIKEMPYANVKENFKDLTMDYDSSENLMLALDRGENPPPYKYDNHEYLARRLAARTRLADFKLLPPPVQNLYDQRIQMHEQMNAQHLQEVQRLESGFIPTSGYMVVCDLYVPDPKDPTSTKRARIPYDSIQWLVQQLEAQGQSLEQLNSANPGVQDDVARMVNSTPPPMMGGQGQPPGPMRAGPGPMAPPHGAGMPMARPPGGASPGGVAHVNQRPPGVPRH